MLAEKTFFGFGRYECFTRPKSKHITTDTIHCIHVTNNGASSFTVSPLRSALFTNTVTIDTILHLKRHTKRTEKLFLFFGIRSVELNKEKGINLPV